MSLAFTLRTSYTPQGMYISNSDRLPQGKESSSLKWKKLNGFKHEYWASNTGLIKNRFKILGGTKLNGTGYKRVNIGGKAYLLHRLVADAFIKNPKKKPFINHKNGIKTDNRVCNLEWVTRAENASHASRTGLVARGERQGAAKLTEKDVLQIRAWPSGYLQRDIAKKYGVAQQTISKIKSNFSWRHIKEQKKKQIY